MGEIERRRRRLRPSAHPAPAAAPPAGPAGTDPARGDAPRTAAAASGSTRGDAPADPAAAPDPVAAATPPGGGATAAEPEGTVAGAVTSAVADVTEEPARPTPAGLPARPGMRAGAAGNGRPGGGRPVPGAGGEEAERGLRGLVGSGSSQVSLGAALRARDAARPTEAHLADAEANLAIVRRNWLPREDLPRNR
jgi:hypothetical protein